MPATATDIVTLKRAKAELGLMLSNTRHDALILGQIPEAVSIVSDLLSWPLVDTVAEYRLRFLSDGTTAVFNTPGDVRQPTALIYVPEGDDTEQRTEIDAPSDDFSLPQNETAFYVTPDSLGLQEWPEHEAVYPIRIEVTLSRDSTGVPERYVAGCTLALRSIYAGLPVDVEALEAQLR